MNSTGNKVESVSQMDTRLIPARNTRSYRRLRYPLPPRTSHTPDGTWTRPAILASLTAGGWFASPSTRYKFESPAVASYAAQTQAFFDEFLIAQQGGLL